MLPDSVPDSAPVGTSGTRGRVRTSLSDNRLGRVFCGVLIAFSVVILGAYWINRASTLQDLEAASLREAERDAVALTEAVSEQTKGVVYTIDLALQHAVHVYGMSGRLTLADAEMLKASAPEGLVRRVTVADAQGRVSLSFPVGGVGHDQGNRSHFLAHSTGPSPGLFVGAPFQSLVDGGWVIPVSRPLLDPGGRLLGVISALLDPDYFAQIYQRLVGAERGVVALTLGNGAFLSRSQNLAAHLGKSVREDRPFIHSRAPVSGSFRAISSHEQVERIFAYRRLNEWPLVTLVGLDVAVALQPVREKQVAERDAALAVSALVVFLVAGICVVVIRLERSLDRANESDHRRAMAFAGANELAWEWDTTARQVRFFGNCQPFFGQAVDEIQVSVERWMARVIVDDQHGVRQQAKAFMLGQSVGLESRYRFQFADGEYRWVLVRGRGVAADRDGRLIRAVGILMDIDAHHKAEIASAQIKEAYRSLIESTSEGIFVVDQAGVIQLFNPAAERLLGWTADEVIGREVHPLLHDAPDAPATLCPVLQTLHDNRSRRGVRLIYRHKSGRPVPVEISIAPITLDGEAEGAVALIVDVSRQIAYETELERLARTDGLTGLWNRRYFVELFLRELKRTERDLSPLSLVMIDIDHFKEINDQYGHAAGDSVLVALADFFRVQLREVDIIGRLGGEEFGIGLPGIGLDEARGVAERLRAGMEALNVLVGEAHVHCTISIGVVVWDRKESFDALLGRADKALYQAKEGGRNRVVA